MIHFSYTWGELWIIDVPREAYTLHFIFFYDENFGHDQVHLFEHLFFHPYRKFGNKYLHELSYNLPPLHSKTTAVHLDLGIRCHHEEAHEMTEIFVRMMEEPFEIDQKYIDQELAVIVADNEKGADNGIRMENLSINPYGHRQYKQGDFVNLAMLQSQFSRLIVGNKPLIVAKWNTHKLGVSSSISQYNTGLQSNGEKHMMKPIYWEVERQQWNRQQFATWTKSISLFSSIPHYEEYGYSYHVMMAYFVEELIYDFVRIQQQISYHPFTGSYRLTNYAQEIFAKFNIDVDSEEFYVYLDNFFHKDEAYYIKLRNKIAFKIRTFTDLDIEYYHISNHYYYEEKIRRTSYIAKQIEETSYEDFMKYYKLRLRYLSVFVS